MAVPSETASASEEACDLFGGQELDLLETHFGVDFSGEPSKPVNLQPVFGRDNFDNLDFARAVDSCFKSLESKPILLPWESNAGKPIFQPGYDYMDGFNMGSIFRPSLPGPGVELSVQKKIKLSPPVVLSSNFIGQL